jgi:nicotinamide-nucleotide amidase
MLIETQEINSHKTWGPELEMKAEVVAIGSELLLGQIIDTNSSHIARVLAGLGIELVRTATVGDDLERIAQAIREAIARSPIVITTGGLGPTEDDLTRDSIAHVTHRPLVFQPLLMDQIEAIFQRRGFRMSENNRRQAFIPEGAIPIENPKGTAPGFIVEGPDYATISIPGVPSEMIYLMEHAVLPYLRQRFSLERGVIRYKTLRACGLGESGIGLQIQDLMKESRNPTVGTLASVGDIKIRIAAKAESPEEASEMIGKMESEIRRRLGTLIYGVDEETLHGKVAEALERLKLSLSVAETFTGGLISHKITSAGISGLAQGYILPLGVSQKKFLDTGEEGFDSLIRDQKRFAEAMARRARELCDTDLGLAVCASFLKEEKEKEFRIDSSYALSTSKGEEYQEYSLGGELSILRERVSIIALDFLRKYLYGRISN